MRLSVSPPRAYDSDAAVEERFNESDRTIQRLTLLGDFVSGRSQEAFDASVYLAVKRYMKKHQATRLAAQHLLDSDLIPSSDFAVMTWSEKAHLALTQPFRSRIGRVVLVLEVVLIVLTLVAIVVESMPRYNPTIHVEQHGSWVLLDGIISNIFLIELIVTIATHPPPRRKIIFSARTVIDFVSILPFYVELFFDRSRRNIIGFLKATRVLRLGKVLLLVDSFMVIVMAMRKSGRMLVAPLLGSVFVMMVLSAMLYFAERGQYDPEAKVFLQTNCTCETSAAYITGNAFCPKVESKFQSIADALYVMIQTVTTVGYGDIVPLCDVGKIIAIAGMFFGSLSLSLPIAIVGSYYSLLELEKQERVKELRRTLTHSGIANSSFVSLGSDSSFLETVNALGKVADEANRGGPQSPSEMVSGFLAAHVTAPARPRTVKQRSVYAAAPQTNLLQDAMDRPGSALTHCNLYHPSPEVMYFLDLFLHDFAEELHLVGRKQPAPCEFAQLLPTSTGASSHSSDNVSIGSVKDQTSFDVRVYERIGDDTLSSGAQERLRVMEMQRYLRESERRRTKALFFEVAELGIGPAVFSPGIYSGCHAATVRLVTKGEAVAAGGAVDSAAPSLRLDPRAAMSRQRPATVSIRFPPHEVSAPASLGMGSAPPADTPGAVSLADISYSAEPVTRRHFGNAVPALAAHTWRLAHTSPAYGAAGGFVEERSALEGSDSSLLERQLFCGNVVNLGGVSYQYLNDTDDLTRATNALECALFDIRRGHLARISERLYGMPIDGVSFRATTGDPVAAGVTQASTKADAGRASSLRRRGRSPPQALAGNFAASTHPSARTPEAEEMRRAHTTVDGELVSPFLSTHSLRPAMSAEAAASHTDRQRKRRLKRFSRGDTGGSDAL